LDICLKYIIIVGITLSGFSSKLYFFDRRTLKAILCSLLHVLLKSKTRSLLHSVESYTVKYFIGNLIVLIHFGYYDCFIRVIDCSIRVSFGHHALCILVKTIKQVSCL